MRNRSVIFSLILTILLLAMSGRAAGQVGVAISIAPPPIPVYEQPICPEEGYIWTPGYWAYDYDDADYYWVPGTWVPAPEVGFLWTPGYWAWGGDRFVFTAGYWGPVVGFYGGINYGFGYFGHGFEGGRWDGGHFYYNTTVNRVNMEVVHNVYNTRVTETTVNRVSYNGGNGGINARASAQEEAAARQRRIAPVSAQVQQERTARSDKQQRASVNHGAPAVAATPKPGGFRDSGVVTTREAGGPYKPAPRSENNNNTPRPENNTSRPVIHPNDLPRADRPAAPNTGNPKQDLKYQQEQEKLQAKQQKDLQKLQQKQEQEHQQVAKQQANQAKQQQMEQRHEQQTQQLQQKHDQQTQQLHQRQQPPPSTAPHQSENKPPR
jgi:hypothetical protein